MSKTAITGLFVGAVVAAAVGIAIGFAAVVTALANGAVVIGGPQVVTLHGGPMASAIPALLVAALLVAAGTVLAIASWAGALLNTSRLADKTWFVALLVLGLASLGWVAMIAYVVAGPDSTRHDTGLPRVQGPVQS